MTAELDLEVAHAVLWVRDLEKLIGFYCEVLGFEVTDRGPIGGGGAAGAEIVFLSQTARAHHQLALVGGRTDDRPSPNLNHIAFRSRGTLADLRSLHERLVTEPDVSRIRPLTHGNAWSVYFADPEGNGIEIFIDTPWHVAQPCGLPLDLSRSDEELLAWTEEQARAMPRFGPIEDFYQARADHLATRQP
ncbi:MAG: VOC family protein [Acidimicrobiales bacterium]